MKQSETLFIPPSTNQVFRARGPQPLGALRHDLGREHEHRHAGDAPAALDDEQGRGPGAPPGAWANFSGNSRAIHGFSDTGKDVSNSHHPAAGQLQRGMRKKCKKALKTRLYDFSHRTGPERMVAKAKSAGQRLHGALHGGARREPHPGADLLVHGVPQHLAPGSGNAVT